MKNFKVISITSDLEAYPEYTANTLEHPDLVPYVEDDYEVFIVNVDKPTNWYRASEFFQCVTGHYTVTGYQ